MVLLYPTLNNIHAKKTDKITHVLGQLNIISSFIMSCCNHVRRYYKTGTCIILLWNYPSAPLKILLYILVQIRQLLILFLLTTNYLIHQRYRFTKTHKQKQNYAHTNQGFDWDILYNLIIFFCIYKYKKKIIHSITNELDPRSIMFELYTNCKICLNGILIRQ